MAKNGVRSSFKNKSMICLIIICCLMATCVALMGVSFAKYVDTVEDGSSASVLGFNPTLTSGDSWEQEGSFVVSASRQNSSLPFKVTNEDGKTQVCVIITLTAEDVLPLIFEVKVGDEVLTPKSVNGDVRVYEYFIDDTNEANFSLDITLQEGEYDERFNGVSNHFHFLVVCEQVIEGGAS